MFWISSVKKHFEREGYDVLCEHPVKGNGAVDILATKPGQKVAVEVETGKSDVKSNLKKVRKAGFDRIVLLATSPSAVTACQTAIDSAGKGASAEIEVLNWLDVS